MACRTALLGCLAAILAAGCDRAAVPPGCAEAVARAPAGPVIAPPTGDRLADPVPVEADGRPLVRQGAGYALQYPFVGDLDGDGRPDLLLGDRERGRLRVYRDVGTGTARRLTASGWFDEVVPTGKVPYG